MDQFHDALVSFAERRDITMDKENKTYSMSIRVSEDELAKLKQAARLEAYASYREFVRRTALIEASKIIKRTKKEGRKN